MGLTVFLQGHNCLLRTDLHTGGTSDTKIGIDVNLIVIKVKCRTSDLVDAGLAIGAFVVDGKRSILQLF